MNIPSRAEEGKRENRSQIGNNSRRNLRRMVGGFNEKQKVLCNERECKRKMDTEKNEREEMRSRVVMIY